MYPVRGKIDFSKRKTPVERLRMSYVEDMKGWCDRALTAENPELREEYIQHALEAAEAVRKGTESRKRRLNLT